MTRPEAGLLDTSVVISLGESRRAERGLLPLRSYLCVITMAGLTAGVLAADDPKVHAQRLNTLTSVSGLQLLPVDGSAASHWARLRVALRQAGRRTGVNALWIASVALANGLPVITQDAEFDALAELGELDVVRV